MIRRETKIFFYGSPPVVYNGAGFYKYLTSRNASPLASLLQRAFDVETFMWSKRVRYKLSQKQVYIIDSLSLGFSLIKRSIDKDILVTLGYPALEELIILSLISRLRRIPIVVRDTHWYWPQTRIFYGISTSSY